MKLFKFLGWLILGIFLLAGLAYGFLPTIGQALITQGLTNQGFTNVDVTIERPNTQALTIPSLAFTTPAASGATSIIIDNTKITYSLDSLIKNMVDTVSIEHITIDWNSSLLEESTDSSPSLATPSRNSRFNFNTLSSEAWLPVLPFQHLHVHHVDIANPSAPPTLQEISLNANVDAIPEGYEGSVHLKGETLLLNLLNVSLTQDGTVSVIGTHASNPEDRLLDLETTLKPSGSSLKLHGKAKLEFHPLIHTLTALYPLPPHYQSITGTFSGNWTGAINDESSPSGSIIGPIQGDFRLGATIPTWPPLAQDIQIQTQGTMSFVDETVTLTVLPSSSGSVKLTMDTFIPPAIESFIRHDDRRSVSWNIRKPVHVKIPIKNVLDSAQIPSGTIHMAMNNSSEKLDMLLSSKGLLWTQTSKISGKAQVQISAQLNPGPAPTWHPEELYLEGHASIALSPNQIDVAFNPSSYFRFLKMKQEPIRVPTLTSRFPQGATATYLLDKKTLTVKTTASSLSLPSVFMQDQEWRFQKISTKDLTIHNTPQRWTIKGDSTIKKVQVPFDAINIPDSNWQARYSASPQSLKAQFIGQTREYPLQVGGQIGLNRLTGDGVGTLALQPIQLSPQTLVLSQLIQPWPNPNMDVTHGTVSASAEIAFRHSPTNLEKPLYLKHLHGILDVKEIGGFFKPTIIEGLTTRVEILGKDETLRIPLTPLHIRKIQSAVEVGGTSLLYSTKPFTQTSLPTLSIKNMSTHLLGGIVSLENATIDPKAETHEVDLQVTGLDLNEILGLEQQESVKGTGTLNGTLPLTVSRTESGTTITVQQGTIQGQAPGGTLQFEVDKETAKSWVESQPQLDLIVKTLENYHYSKLAVGVDYQKNGILTLATKLEGKNPDFRNGVPIHFNLNIEENIPALMKSLSLVKGLEENIEKMMKEKNTSLSK